MAIALGGLHHVTAVTSQAPENVAFYTDTLGLHLVKKTVNQDDVSAYHLFYADADGNAGTELTFFDWAHVPANEPGTGEVAAIGRRSIGGPSASASVAWRKARLSSAAVGRSCRSPTPRDSASS